MAGGAGLSWDSGSLHDAPGARQNHMFPISCSGLLVQGVLAGGDLFWLQTPAETTQEREEKQERGSEGKRGGEQDSKHQREEEKTEGERETQRETHIGRETEAETGGAEK